ncbi:hypothetical protein BHM03_00024582 [Ensete ventricosum]|nr:hypothetical protein BHM03_00024582 [Ensete ventricosum]
MAYKPPSVPSHPSLPKKLTKEELRDRSTKGLCWHCDEPWSRDYRCKKGRLLLIEPIEYMEEEVREHEEEVMDEERQPIDITMHALTDYTNPQMMKVGGLLKQQTVTFPIDTGSTNNFMNSKVAVRMALPIEDCSRFYVKFADGRILKCDRRCPRVKLLLQDQEIIAYFFLLPLDDCEIVLGIEWLTTLGDVSWNFLKLIMKFCSQGKQVVLHGKRGSDISTICTRRMEKVSHKTCSDFLLGLKRPTL